MSTTPQIQHLPTRDGYDRWSSIYDSESNPLIVLEERIAFPLLGEVANLKIADIGCGTGRHALRLASQAAQVTAVDFSQGMLDAAKLKPGASNITWIQHDLSQPLPLPANSFDRVVCALVFDHITDVTHLFRELARICKSGPDNFVLVTIMHPAIMLNGVQARFTDPTSGTRIMPQSVPNQISDYVMGATRASLTISHMSEHSVDDDLIAICPRAEKHRTWPLLLIMKLHRSVTPAFLPVS